MKGLFKNKTKLKSPYFRDFKSYKMLKISMKEIFKFQDALLKG
jgi:hypothetical protein